MRGMRRYYEQGAAYYITSVTEKRQRIFEDSRACEFLIKCLEYHKLIYSFKFFGFVIMPEHLHCVIQPAPGTTISEIMRHIKGNFARNFNRIVRTRGYIWQQSFYDRMIRDETHILAEIDYMHNNPVRAGLVALPEDYKYSSYHYYFGNEYLFLVDYPS